MDDDVGQPIPEAFEQMYRASYPDVVRYGYRRTGDMQVAQEIAQEVFLIAWRRRSEAARIGLPWLYATAWRLLANHWRSDRRRPATVPLDCSPDPTKGEDPFELVNVAHDVAAAFRQLSAADQELIRLVMWENLSTAQLAQVLGCPRVTAAVRLHRARQRMRRQLGYTQDRSRPAAMAQVCDE